MAYLTILTHSTRQLRYYWHTIWPKNRKSTWHNIFAEWTYTEVLEISEWAITDYLWRIFVICGTFSLYSRNVRRPYIPLADSSTDVVMAVVTAI